MIRSIVIACLSVVLSAAERPATVDVKVERQPLLVALEQLARQCKAGLIVQEGLVDTVDRDLTLVIERWPWERMAALLGEQHDLDLAIVGRDLVVRSATEVWLRRLELRHYDVRALTMSMMNHPGPALRIPEPGSAGMRVPPPIAGSSPPLTSEVIEVLTTTVAPEMWKRQGMTIEEFQHELEIVAPPEIHAQVRAALDRLERSAGRQLVARIYEIAAPTARSLPPVVSAEQWAGAARDLQPIGTIAAFDGQRAHALAGTMRAYVADADMVQRADSPIVTVIADGLCVDVAPHVTLGGVLATLRVGAFAQQALRQARIVDGRDRQLAAVDLPTAVESGSQDDRLIPFGGASLHRLGERYIAIAFEVLRYDQSADASPAAVPAAPAATPGR